MPRPAARRVVNKNWLLAVGPAVAATVGVLTNLITATWNWWFFTVLITLVGLSSLVVVIGEGGMRAPRPDQATTPELERPVASGEATGRSAWLGVPLQNRHFVGRADLLHQLDDGLT